MQPDAVDIQVDDGLSVGIHKRCHSHVLKTPRSRDMMASARVGGDHCLQYCIITTVSSVTGHTPTMN